MLHKPEEEEKKNGEKKTSAINYMQSVFALQFVYPIWSRTLSEFAYDGSEARKRETVQNSSTREPRSTRHSYVKARYTQKKRRKKKRPLEKCVRKMQLFRLNRSGIGRHVFNVERKKNGPTNEWTTNCHIVLCLARNSRELVKSPGSAQPMQPMQPLGMRRFNRSIFVLDSNYTRFNWNDAQHTFCISRYANSVHLCSFRRLLHAVWSVPQRNFQCDVSIAMVWMKRSYFRLQSGVRMECSKHEQKIIDRNKRKNNVFFARLVIGE